LSDELIEEELGLSKLSRNRDVHLCVGVFVHMHGEFRIELEKVRIQPCIGLDIIQSKEPVISRHQISACQGVFSDP
jgi:hypothetical protein